MRQSSPQAPQGRQRAAWVVLWGHVRFYVSNRGYSRCYDRDGGYPAGRGRKLLRQGARTPLGGTDGQGPFGGPSGSHAGTGITDAGGRSSPGNVSAPDVETKPCLAPWTASEAAGALRPRPVSDLV